MSLAVKTARTPGRDTAAPTSIDFDRRESVWRSHKYAKQTIWRPDVIDKMRRSPDERIVLHPRRKRFHAVAYVTSRIWPNGSHQRQRAT
jgi:hypothetical protein